MSGPTIDWASLVSAAWGARERAYAPYSQYRVGAALLDEEGRVFLGANVENASYGLCLCAERAAIGSAIAAGARRFAAIAVVTGGVEPGSPCGMCRQVLSEFAPSFPVRCVAEGGAMIESSVEALLPHAFGPAVLGVATEGARSTIVGTGDRHDTDRPPASLTTSPAFVGVALKVAAGTGGELAAAEVASLEGDPDARGRT